MLVVIDTSTLVSGVLWPGLPHRLVELAEAGEITLCVTEETLVELRGVLSRPKFEDKIRDRFTSVEEIMQGVLALAALYPTIPISGIVQADPGDDKFVACALAAGADYLISSDEHLLDLRSVGDVRILTAREFLAERFPAVL
jgi:putative PIN family toxin of toxin-antitoxin system